MNEQTKTLLPTIALSSGEQFPLKKDGLKIGSMAAICDIVIDDPAVSAVHCAIVRTEAGWAVQELQSNTGVLLNGEAVEKGSTTPIAGGAVLTVGGETLTFQTNQTLFSEYELKDLNDMVQLLDSGKAISPEVGQNAIYQLEEKIGLIRSAFGLQAEQAAARPQQNSTMPQQNNAATQQNSAMPQQNNPVPAPYSAPSAAQVQPTPVQPAPTPFAPELDDLNNRIISADNLDPVTPPPVVFNTVPVNPQAPTMCFLAPTEGMMQQCREKAICVKRLPFNIGTDPQNDYVMADGYTVSPVHAQILNDPATGAFVLKNKDKDYGTYINKQLIAPEESRPIKPGDVIQFGTIHRYQVENLVQSGGNPYVQTV